MSTDDQKALRRGLHSLFDRKIFHFELDVSGLAEVLAHDASCYAVTTARMMAASTPACGTFLIVSLVRSNRRSERIEDIKGRKQNSVEKWYI